jgi:hypothetical protein
MRNSAILLFALILASFSIFGQTCPVSGLTTLSTNPNTYYPGTQATVSVGASSITLGAAASGTPIAIGDLVLIIQMQGAEINSNNSNSYGNGVAGGFGNGYLNNTNHLAGNMEYAVATSAVPLIGGTLNIASGTAKSYKNASFGTFGQYRYQVIRIPIYFNLTLGANITAPEWDGTTGGILAIQVANNFSFGGFSLSAVGKGFRGGASTQTTYPAIAGASNTDFRTLASADLNASKGEGTAGTPRFVNNAGVLLDNGALVEGYPNGSRGQGAPGNAGGGNTDGATGVNCGGGGGGNGASGGKGGNGWDPSGSGAASGGEPGAVFAEKAANRVVMGGGGGGGGTNDGTGTPGSGFASSGAAGGGIVIVCAKNITTAGSVNVNGNSANNTVTNDGSGGGGAAGSVLIFVSTGHSFVTVTANGGNGGTNSGAGSAHGPGGGGSGGVVISSANLNAASTVTRGTAGTTAVSGNYGASNGTTGTLIQNALLSQFPPNFNTCLALVLPVNLISFNYAVIDKMVELQWQVSDEINLKEYIVEKSEDGNQFNYLGTIPSSALTGAFKNYVYKDAITPMAYYRLKMVDIDGQYRYSKILLYKNAGLGVNDITVYPNPAGKNTYIRLPIALRNKNLRISLNDETGRTLYTKNQKANSTTLLLTIPENVFGMVVIQIEEQGSQSVFRKLLLIR